MKTNATLGFHYAAANVEIRITCVAPVEVNGITEHHQVRHSVTVNREQWEAMLVRQLLDLGFQVAVPIPG